MQKVNDSGANASCGAPDIDCILIGVNCEKTLERCINSIKASDYPKEKLHICYVDGGSTDGSIKSAMYCEGVEIIAIQPEYPTPGIGRNTGWKAGSAPLVQFLDSDTVLDSHWLTIAVKAIGEERIGAILGTRREIHPESSLFNWIGDLEWNGPAGDSNCFGGDVLIRRKVLEQTGGYDEELVGGEDPELSRRLIRAGWKITRLDAPMTKHDLAMTKISHYVRRAYRSGYGFAAVRQREANAGSNFWQYEHRKIVIRGGGFIGGIFLSSPLLFAGSLSATSVAIILLGTGTTLLLMPRLFKVENFMKEHRLERRAAKKYAWHCSLVVLPQLAGLLRFYFGQLFGKPLRNRRNRLATATSGQET